jgi:methionyl-tRNA formyltransferase
MRIVILTSRTPSNIWLVNQLISRHDVVGMVIERTPLALTWNQKLARRRRMVQKFGVARTLNRLIYNWLQSRLVATLKGDRATQHFFPDGAPVVYSREIASVTVDNINDQRSIEFIQRHAPDALAVCGTTIIRPEVFSIASRGAINIHTGITPEYRSAEPIFWALFHGEPHKVGVTIHCIDRGVDTGPIIHQATVPVYAQDSLDSIYFRCIRRGAELFSRALSEIEAGSICTVNRETAESRAFRSIDLGIVEYIRFQWRFRRLTKRLPREKSTAEVSERRGVQ